MTYALRGHSRAPSVKGSVRFFLGTGRIKVQCAMRTLRRAQAHRPSWQPGASWHLIQLLQGASVSWGLHRRFAASLRVSPGRAYCCGSCAISLPLSWLHITDIFSSQHIHAFNTKAASLRNYHLTLLQSVSHCSDSFCGYCAQVPSARGHLSRMARGRKPSQPDAPADLLKGTEFTRPPACACCLACSATPWTRLGCRHQCICDGQAVSRLQLAGIVRGDDACRILTRCS